MECPRPPAEINQLLLERGIVGGFDLSKVYPNFENCMLLCATEANSTEQIDALAAAMLDVTGEGRLHDDGATAV